MFCSNCGSQVNGNFCQSCGAQQTPPTPQAQPAATQPVQQPVYAPANPVQPMPGGQPVPQYGTYPQAPYPAAQAAAKKKPKGLFIAIGAVVLVAILLIVLFQPFSSVSPGKFIQVMNRHGFSTYDQSMYSYRYTAVTPKEMIVAEGPSWSDFVYFKFDSSSTGRTAYRLLVDEWESSVVGDSGSPMRRESSTAGWKVYCYVNFYHDEYIIIAQKGGVVIICDGDTDDQVSVQNIMKEFGISGTAIAVY